MKYVSLFSGIGGFEKGLLEVFPDAECVGFCEINKRAVKTYTAHFPKHELIAKDIREFKWTKELSEKHGVVDLVVAGFPCQDLSTLSNLRSDPSQRQCGVSGEKSGLVTELVRLLGEIKPKWFVVENVGRSKQTDRDKISKLLGVRPVSVDARYFSAQKRNRLFWTNFPVVEPTRFTRDTPTLHSILDTKENAMTMKLTPKATAFMSKFHKGRCRYDDRFECVDSDTSKAHTLTSRGDIPRSVIVDKRFSPPLLREFTVREMERMQCFPDGWVGDISMKKAKKMLGNAVNVRVVRYIMQQLLDHNNALREDQHPQQNDKKRHHNTLEALASSQNKKLCRITAYFQKAAPTATKKADAKEGTIK